MHRKFHQNRTKLREKNCERMRQMWGCRARAKYRQIQSTIIFYLRLTLTCRLKLWDDKAGILPYMNCQGNRNRGKVPTRLAKNA